MFTPLYTFAKASLYNFVCTAQLLSVSQQLQRNASETLAKSTFQISEPKIQQTGGMILYLNAI